MTRGIGKRRIGVASVIVILVIAAYIISIIAYSLSGQSATEKGAELLPKNANGVNIGLDLLAIDTTKNQMTLRIVPIPQGDYLDRDSLAFAKPVRITIYGQTSGAISREIPAGDPVGAVEAPIFITGNANTYPLDRYEYANPENLSQPWPFMRITTIGEDGRQAPVPTGVDPDIGGVQGWAESWTFADSADNEVLVRLTIKRAGGVLAFVFVVLALMLVMVALALAVAVFVIKRKRAIEPTMAGWFAALLFALIPLRNFLPGAPPIGAWIDVLVFYWVEVGIMVSMSAFILMWLKFGRKPDPAPKPDPTPDAAEPQDTAKSSP